MGGDIACRRNTFHAADRDTNAAMNAINVVSHGCLPSVTPATSDASNPSFESRLTSPAPTWRFCAARCANTYKTGRHS